ncbi:MaoC/PaaZ C-terminal domain-containing protein [Dactylosporangium sp. AC04546]|uniref:MaoC/PaaZ C-terminal domain-containing protein n=1 Tax=Dactylosporangium sp. AC04546 TaxID=2862460 RepID=UPI001EE009EF|nr:MaoC/PaaZ C-terminal domain-containing protein [Dactylosporangium sp. AC04546]WVK80658.1 MaoC/PaaZ C-terminal domain-containing protein [Dactylosporangium sp. AC04546]
MTTVDRTANLLLTDVAADDRLPELSHGVTATSVVLGALATRDWRPMHHDRDFAIHHSGTRDIFLNTPNQAHWFERYVSDWAGPKARLGRLEFRMRTPVCPGDRMVVSGEVTEVAIDTMGCGWATLALRLTVGDEDRTVCIARVALPIDADDNPWTRRDSQWIP